MQARPLSLELVRQLFAHGYLSPLSSVTTSTERTVRA